MFGEKLRTDGPFPRAASLIFIRWISVGEEVPLPGRVPYAAIIPTLRSSSSVMVLKSSLCHLGKMRSVGSRVCPCCRGQQKRNCRRVPRHERKAERS